MGQKDIIEKNLEDFNDVFADIVNVLVFQGKRTIKPRELKPLAVRSQYKADDGKLHEEERDNAKYWSKGRVKIALLGLENQTTTDPDMPFRAIAYDGAAYRSQLLNKKSKQRCPVLSIVLYFGNSHWSGSKTIHEMIQIPEGLEQYINDYKIHVFEISHLTRQQVKLFKSDFRIVADYFVQVRKNKTYIPSKKTIKHVDAILKFMTVMTGDQRFSDISEKAVEGGDRNMCEVLDRIENRGIEKGIKIGEDNMRGVLDQIENQGIEKGIKIGEDNMRGVLDQIENQGIEKGIKIGEDNMRGVLDQIENQGIEKGIKIGEDNMRAERDSALIEKDNALAEKDNALAEKDSALAEKDNALAEAEILRAENDRMKKLLAEYNIATA